MAIQHTVKCIVATAKAQQDLAIFAAKHPRYCRPCHGLGSTLQRNYPYEPDEREPCPDCVQMGICPMCGAEAVDEEGLVCSVCGWLDGFGVGAPNGQGECECGMDVVNAPFGRYLRFTL